MKILCLFSSMLLFSSCLKLSDCQITYKTANLLGIDPCSIDSPRKRYIIKVGKDTMICENLSDSVFMIPDVRPDNNQKPYYFESYVRDHYVVYIFYRPSRPEEEIFICNDQLRPDLDRIKSIWVIAQKRDAWN